MTVQHDPPLLPDLDQLREVITDTEERARLLRLLLRAATRLHLHLITADQLTSPQTKGERHG